MGRSELRAGVLRDEGWEESVEGFAGGELCFGKTIGLGTILDYLDDHLFSDLLFHNSNLASCLSCFALHRHFISVAQAAHPGGLELGSPFDPPQV